MDNTMSNAQITENNEQATENNAEVAKQTPTADNSLIEQMELGRLDVSRYDDDCDSDWDDQTEASVTDSLLEVGQLKPIDYTIVDGTPRIVKGYHVYNIIRKLMRAGKWEGKIKLNKVDADKAIEIYCATTMAHHHLTSMQRAIWGNYHLRSKVEALAKENQANGKKDGKEVKTDNTIALKVNSNHEYARVTNLLLSIDKWFYFMIFQHGVKMSKEEIVELGKMDEDSQKLVAAKMKELYEKGKKPEKTLFRDAKSNIANSNAQKDKKTVQSATGIDPEEMKKRMDKINHGINQAYEELSWEDIKIPGKIIIDFKLPQTMKDSLHALILSACGHDIEWVERINRKKKFKLEPAEAEAEECYNKWLEENEAEAKAKATKTTEPTAEAVLEIANEPQTEENDKEN